MSATILLPCPFCEGPPVAICVRGVGGGVFTDDEMIDDGLYVEAYVFCHECGAQGPSHRVHVFERAECDDLTHIAVSEWNQRNARHRELYDAGTDDGLNVWPRWAMQPERRV